MTKILFKNNIANVDLSKVDISDFKHEKIGLNALGEELDVLLDRKVNELLDNYSELTSIIIPLSVTENLMEFSGLQLAYHLRLSKQHKQAGVLTIPLVLYGVFSEFQLFRLTYLAQILLTPNVYYFNICDCKFESVISFVNDKLSTKTDEFDYNQFLSVININPPENYESRHSIANEWALTRYFSLLKPSDNQNYVKLNGRLKSLTYTKTLHYKYTDALFEIQKINTKKHIKNNPSDYRISNIENKSIAVIDDEISIGWKEFYSYLFDLSKAGYYFYEDFQEMNKEELIHLLKHWCVEKIKLGCSIFLLDLRLHPDDFDSSELNRLSGIIIAKYIRSLNPGIQIVIFTASNKIWNYQDCLSNGIIYYAVKSSPEVSSSRKRTEEDFNRFISNVSEAGKMSFFAELFDDMKDLKSNNSLKLEEPEFYAAVFYENGIIDQIWNLLYASSIGDYSLNLNQCLLLCFSVL